LQNLGNDSIVIENSSRKYRRNVRRDHGVGQFTVMQNGASSGASAHDIESEFTAGVKVDHCFPSLTIAKGYGGRGPAIESQDRP
jgi:hypothetical protein